MFDKIAKNIKRQLAMTTLAFTDVSKSALANQKTIGLDGASQAISQSVLSETKQTLGDMLQGRQTQQTRKMARQWWLSHVRMQRCAMIDGVWRELTDEEWRARWEKAADPANKDLGPVVFMHKIETTTNDNAVVSFDENNKATLRQGELEATRRGNFKVTADQGFYFPLQTIQTLLVRQQQPDGAYAIELHTSVTKVLEVDEQEQAAVRAELQSKVNFTLPPVNNAVDNQNGVTYAMTMDPDMRYLLTGIRRVALTQAEYSGVVARAFTLHGEPRVSTPYNGIVLTYEAHEALVTPQELLALNPETSFEEDEQA
jgi:hypothetical protein